MKFSAAILSLPGVFLLASTVVDAGCPFSGLLRGDPTEDDAEDGQEGPIVSSLRSSYPHRNLQSCQINLQVPSVPFDKIHLSGSHDSYNAFAKAVYDELVAQAGTLNPTFTPQGLIRLAFHECIPFNQPGGGGSGSDGSIAGELGPGFFPNARLGGHWGVLDGMVSSGNYPGITIADAAHIAAAVAVEAYGGPHYTLLVGRNGDYTEDDVCDNPRLCWPPAFAPNGLDISGHTEFLVDMYNNLGISNPERALVASSGAHTLGGVRIPRFGLVFDFTSESYTFDNGYFQNIIDWWEKGGAEHFATLETSPNGCPVSLLPSDILLGDPANAKLRKITERYASDQDLFFKDFAGFMKDCSLVGVNNRKELVDPFPPSGGTPGGPPGGTPGGPPGGTPGGPPGGSPGGPPGGTPGKENSANGVGDFQHD
jgi:hypothetical protein